MRTQVFLACLGVAGSAIAVGQLTAVSAPDGSRLGGDHLDSQADFMGHGSGGNIYDVQPCIIGSLGQFGAIGAHPHGTVGLALLTTGHNNGNVTLPWYRSPDVDHPLIAMNMYRVNDEGRLEQIGLSWLKHAWAAVQGTACGQCQSSGSSRILGIGCADTYGAGLNADQRWLGPRWEIKPHEHKWMDGASFTGSHFARNNGGNDSGSHNAIEHRLRVRMGDLTTPDSQYYYEGVYYLLKDHADKNYQWPDLFEAPAQMNNNARHQLVNVSRNGNSFSFSDNGESVEGPITLSWGDIRDQAMPQDEGLVYVSSRSVDLGNGLHRYEYAVYNLNLDREVGSINIPVGNAAVTDVGFHAPVDGYWEDENTFRNESPFDTSTWEDEVVDGVLTFTAPTPGGDGETNTIRYGTMYTFWFTSSAPPAQDPGTIEVVPYLAGTNPFLTADIAVPAELEAATLTSIRVLRGELISGGVPQLVDSDDDVVDVEAEVTGEVARPHLIRVRIEGETNVQSATAMAVTIEAAITDLESAATVYLRNWDSGNLVNIGQFSNGLTEQVIRFAVPDPDRFVRSGDGHLELVIREIVLVPFTLGGYHLLLDQVEIGVQ